MISLIKMRKRAAVIDDILTAHFHIKKGGELNGKRIPPGSEWNTPSAV